MGTLGAARVRTNFLLRRVGWGERTGGVSLAEEGWEVSPLCGWNSFSVPTPLILLCRGARCDIWFPPVSCVCLVGSP